MRFKYSKFQKLAIKWLTFFLTLCFVNSILAIKFDFLDDYSYSFAFILPFAHTALIIVSVMVYAGYRWAKDNFIGKNEQYIKCYYPVIWKKLRPGGDFSYNIYAATRFLKGEYDDGTDDKLNHIKLNYKVNKNLIYWAFFLTVVVWLFNFLLVHT